MPESRRGVLLLVALVMLALFMMLGTSYILIANRRRPCTAVAGSSVSTPEGAAENTVDQTTDTTLFGKPDGSGSGGTVGSTVKSRVAKFFMNSLLADKYGDWYEAARLQSIQPVTVDNGSGYTLRFYTITTSGSVSYGPESTMKAYGKAPDLGSHVGRIMSIDSELEPAASFRIVARQGSNYLVHLLNPAAEFDHTKLKAQSTLTIQGREFAGRRDEKFHLHESWDAPDGRNLFMAWVPSEATLGRDQYPGSDDPSAAVAHRYVIPSFHRPDKLLSLVKDDPTAIIQSGSTSWFWAQDIAMLRPAGKMTWDPNVNWDAMYGMGSPPLPQGNDLEHPNFTGGNVRTVGGQQVFFDPLNGPWDVDNDGDGITDSIWMDVGMSPVTIEGADYQPLVAMMILDLDGRINLNAHGTDFVNSKWFGQWEVLNSPGRRYAGTISGTVTGTAAPSRVNLQSGQGWGVAEIDPKVVLGGAIGKVALYTGSSQVEGRYGDSRSGTGALSPAPGLLGQSDRGLGELAADSAAKPRDHYLPDSYAGGSNTDEDRARACALMSPIDTRGDMTVGLDQFGQPYFLKRLVQIPARATSVWLGDRIDDPYDMSLGRGAPRPGWAFDPDVASQPSTLQDNLFNSSQFARILRSGESAASRYSSRLETLVAASGGTLSTARTSATVESWDTTAAIVPSDVLESLLALSDQYDASKPSLVSWDLAMGLRMDVNRPFGDGLDNDSDGLADEPGEYDAEKDADAFRMAAGPFADQCVTNGRDVDGDGDCDLQDQRRARELFARHLYVLARKMVSNLSARDAAQWAVNVVDMRDPDSIITRFPYDANFGPTSTTWDASDPQTVVWGCERPELLITECMAWRNIRSGSNSMTGATEYTDKGTGGLIIELYHPWTGATDSGNRASRLPREFQDPSAGNFTTGQIDLACVNPSGQPVFQILAIKETPSVSGTLANEPSWPQTLSGTTVTNAVPIYLANSSALAMTGSTGTFVSRDGPNAETTTIRPGQFAIISGPVSGTSGSLANQIDTSTSGTGAMTFFWDQFSDATPGQVLGLSTGLTETITGSNGSVSADRSSGIMYPTVGVSQGPVGAMVLVETAASSNVVLRFPATSGTTSDLKYMTQEKYRILLRRLANPTEAHDSTFNPYICIDSLVVQDQAVVASGSDTGLRLKSAERCAAQPADGSVNNLWRHGPDDDATNIASISPTLMGQISGVTASLGFMPARLKVPLGVDDPADAWQPAFPWLTWLNREFVSPHELLLVPRSTPSALLKDHSHTWPFGHLFFQLGSGTTAAETDRESQKVGLLELLRVPSRFADSETRVPPTDALAISNALVSGSGRPLYLPPHNYMSQFREPGRVNLNTMSGNKVWAALNNVKPGAPYEDEVVYGDTGTPLTFVKSNDWMLETGTTSSPFSGNWSPDTGEGSFNVNHDENNDGLQQISKTSSLKSIVSSRRGWPISTSGSTSSIAGQFDRVLNRQGVSTNQLWFSAPFQSGWTSGTTASYAPAQSLMFRSWAADVASNFVRMSRPDNYSRLKRTNGVTMTAFNQYCCTIKVRGSMPLAVAGSHSLPEMLKDGGYGTVVYSSTPTAMVGNGITTYTSTVSPTISGQYHLQIAIWQKAQIDILSVSLVDGSGTELLTNGNFTDGGTGWEFQDSSLQTDTTISSAGPVYLMGKNLGLKDSKGKARTGRPYADPERNPFFRYQEMMRLSNLTTSRSNVFAVWMTVGLFAIEDHPTHTGEKALGAEYGLDTGKNQRFKAFLMIDRSIPVGYRPGVPLNSADTILLEQFGN